MTRIDWLSVVAVLVAMLAAPVPAQELLHVQQVLLKLVEEVDVPAEQAGVLKAIHVAEGEVVEEGKPLAQVDDASARLTEERASADLDMAERKARDLVPIEIARKTAEQARQKLGELRLQEQIAARQAANPFRVEAAVKAQAVAENELQRAEKANERYDDAVSQSEIDGRRLEAEKATLDAKQSRFEREIEELKRDVAQEALRGQELAVGAADLEVSRAETELDMAQMQARIKRHELQIARLDLERRSILSPLDGVVVEIYRQSGEWVEPGEPVLRVLRLNRLWVEGFIRVEDLTKCVEQSEVRLAVAVDDEETIEATGRIVFVGREVDPVNREVLIRAEVPNEDFRLLPGMEGDLTVLGRPAGKSTGSTARAE